MWPMFQTLRFKRRAIVSELFSRASPPEMREVRRFDAETTKPTVVSRLSALGAPTGDGSEVRQHERRGGGVAGRGRADE